MTDVTDTPIAGGPKRAAIGKARELARLRREIASNDEAVDAEIAELELWRETTNAKLAQRVGEVEVELRLWLDARLCDDPGLPKSMTLPGGVTMGFRKGSVTYDVADAAALLAQLRDIAPQAIRRTTPPPPSESPDIGELKRLVKAEALRADSDLDAPGEHKLVTADGEVLCGLVVIRNPETFSVSIDSGD